MTADIIELAHQYGRYGYRRITALLRRAGWTVNKTCPARRLPAAEIERAVLDQLRILLRSPEIIARTFRAARHLHNEISESEVRDALLRLDPLWDELFPAEQARIVQLLVERVEVGPHGADIRLRTEGLTQIAADVLAGQPRSDVKNSMPVTKRRAA